MKGNIFSETFPVWLEDHGQTEGVAVSTRLQMGRNITTEYFPSRMDASARDRFLSFTADILKGALDDQVRWNSFGNLSQTQKRLVTERRFLNPSQVLDHAQILGTDELEQCAFLTTGSDHFQFIGWAGGWNWSESLRRASLLWELFRPHATWAWHDSYGWLGSDLKSLGCSCRLSLLVHLPALEVVGDIIEAMEAAEENRLSFRGFSGGGEKSRGALYQIGTGPSTGRTVHELAEEMNDFLNLLETMEAQARASWQNKAPHLLEDTLGRSLGLLSYARVMPEEEALEHLSHLRLGVILGILKGVTATEINRMYYGVQRGHLSLWAERSGGLPVEWDVLRARYLAASVKEGKIDDV